jgi:hypothetical protein
MSPTLDVQPVKLIDCKSRNIIVSQTDQETLNEVNSMLMKRREQSRRLSQGTLVIDGDISPVSPLNHAIQKRRSSMNLLDLTPAKGLTTDYSIVSLDPHEIKAELPRNTLNVSFKTKRERDLHNAVMHKVYNKKPNYKKSMMRRLEERVTEVKNKQIL